MAHGRFQRVATVIAAEAAGEDKVKVLKQWPDVRRKGRNLPISADHAAVRSKVVLRVARDEGLPCIPEIHVAMSCGVGQPCMVLRAPSRHSPQAHAGTRGARLHTYRDWIEVSDAKAVR